jgi:hypothetical protein
MYTSASGLLKCLFQAKSVYITTHSLGLEQALQWTTSRRIYYHSLSWLGTLSSNDLQIPYIHVHILFHIPVKKAIRWNLKKKATFRASFSCIGLTLIRFTLIHTYRLMHFVKENHRWLHTKNNHKILSTWSPSGHLDFFQKRHWWRDG